ncbi:MAG: HpaII family restriction endonuclease [Peptoniphilaceae bacterium]|nr:HpaII family restriction endonuclease [Peptoniphilaceae bacterium]MDY6018397.1 HpaII family restriction endonuclease [Anaerococcus sp.]
MISGNKGEWSEIYVLFKLLADGKIYAADSELNKLHDIYFPIIKIIREEISGESKEYTTGRLIDIYINGKKIKSVDRSEFEKESKQLLEEICNAKGSTFQIEKTENFMKRISCYKLSAPARDKSDITMKIVDINTGYSPTVGFSIKSELGSSPTLLNAGKTTNFIYKIVHNNPFLVKQTNEIYKASKGNKHTDVRGRIKRIIEDGGQLEYIGMQNKAFSDNLVLIDSSMDNIIAETILYFYRDNISNCVDMVKKLEIENPMNYGNVNAYRYKFKKFLTSVALGMKPATIWDGIDEANGGYIIVNKQGDVLAYHIYNRNYFEEYLLKSTKYETASTSRHDFGEVYSEGGKDFIKLNLQIRFK